MARARLVSGLILFAYLVGHFANHALGLVSLGAMERGLAVLYPVWTNPLVTAALLGAFALHLGLAFAALWQRRTLRMPPLAVLQYALGLSVPFLLIQHVAWTRLADSIYGTHLGFYTHVLTQLWQLDPARGVAQAILLVTAWVHACIGLFYRLRLEPWFERLQFYLFAAALLLPVLALLGYAEAGREVLERIERDPSFFRKILSDRPAPEIQARLDAIVAGGRAALAGIIAVILLARLIRRRLQARRGLVRIVYPEGRSIAVVPGTSVLEASRLLGRPHASVCGGRGRCSTCRVRVSAPERALPPPAPEEAMVLRRIGAEPNVRLACQLRPRGDVSVTPLLPAGVRAREGFRLSGDLLGAEKEIAILFADLRDFTRHAETRLPYDVVFVLNRYFAAMGAAIEQAGGRVDKFIGDGVMALFGLDGGPEAGCRRALDAARLMSRALDDLNASLASDIRSPLRMGIGIHVGRAIVGEMGFGRAVQLTAVGDAVNTASRIEGLCKIFGCELVVSEDVADRAGIDLAAFPRHEVEIRGRREMLVVRAISRARDLALDGGRPALSSGKTASTPVASHGLPTAS